MLIKDKRRGRFKVTTAMINSEPESVRKILSNVIILRAEFDFAYETLEYYALSVLFDEIPAGYLVPEYRFTYDAREKTVSAKRLK